MVIMMKATRKKMFLYKAVKYMVEEYQAEHGFTLPELWDYIKSNTEGGYYWKRCCIGTYAHEVLGWEYSLILRAQNFY